MLPAYSGGKRLGIAACNGSGSVNLRFSAALPSSSDAGKVVTAIKQRAVTMRGRCLSNSHIKRVQRTVLFVRN